MHRMRSSTDAGHHLRSRGRAILLDVFREAIEQGKAEVGKSPIESIFVLDVSITRSRLTLDDYMRIHEEARKGPAERWGANATMLALVSG
ncbi:hypothetical protein WS87_23580 [Burkholderia sp. MSMB0856]|nr:hypothetical protein WS87_23580 [Burkholderia sp. MSMB0856]